MENKEKGKFGWGILGFFFPIVGLILFLVWKNNNKANAKVAGIGALIGVGVEIILTVVAILFGGYLLTSFDSGVSVTLTKADTTLSLDYDIKDSFSVVDWNFDDYYENLSKDYTVNVLNDKGDKLFKIKKVGENYSLVFNSVDEVEINKLFNYGSKFYFYYTNGLVIFSTTDDENVYYFYDVKNDKLVKAFDGTSEDYLGLYVSNIKFEDNSIVFHSYIDGFNNRNIVDGKSEITFGVDGGSYATEADLDAALTKYALNDFTVSADLKYDNIAGLYMSTPTITKTTIKERYKEVKNPEATTEVKRTLSCTGKVSQGVNKYQYKFDLDSQPNTCKTVSYKLNDDFTVKFEYGDDANDTLIESQYVNGKFITFGYSEWSPIYVVGKTLVTREYSTDLGADIYLVNTNGAVYNIDFKEGGNTSKLDLNGMTQKEYKVDDSGNLVITGIRHSNQCEYGLQINHKCATDNICKTGYDSFVSKYSLPANYDYRTELIYNQNTKGLYNMNYSSKNVLKTLKDYYSEECAN